MEFLANSILIFVQCYFLLDFVGHENYGTSSSIGTKVRFAIILLTAT